MGFSSEAHLDRLCNTLCGCDVGSGEERERERDTGRVGVIMRREQKAKVGKRRHPLKSPDPNWPANCRHALSWKRQRNKTGIKINFEQRLPPCQTHRNKSCKLKKNEGE